MTPAITTRLVRFKLEEQISDLIETLENMLAIATEKAHRFPVPFEFDGSQIFTKDQLQAVWEQGRKDAYRFVLVNLREMRGY